MTGIYAVTGKPILHSRSPEMHNAAFSELGLDSCYVRLASDSAQEALDCAKGMGITGMNITSPFKEDFAKLVREKSDGARKLGAVNTVVFKDNGAYGCNTDPDGVFGALGTNGVEIAGRRAVVLGAGGAAKAAVLALLAKNADVVIANRTAAKAKAIADRFGCGSRSMEEIGDSIKNSDILVSALSTAERVVKPQCLGKRLVVLDANYASESALVRDARKSGCTVVDGREWLLHQGAKAFEIFTGKRAPLEAMRKAVYSMPKPGTMGRLPQVPKVLSDFRTQNPKRRTRNSKTRNPKHNLALIGMMGSGKNVVSAELSARTGMKILDIDAEIARKAGKPIAEIFASRGEAGFRKLEAREIKAAEKARNMIINCGGGAILKTQNRETLDRNATVVWLWAKPSTMVKRVAGDGSRPLLHVPDDEKEKVLERALANRLCFYAGTSDMVLDTNDKTPQQIAERILYEVRESGSG